jgi:xylulose-5-phosphate/fructose-6-phosphate phosphoketolase
LEALFVGYAHTPHFVEGNERQSMHQAMAPALEPCMLGVRKLQEEARRTGKPSRPRWPMVVLQSPKGRSAQGKVEDTPWKASGAHQIPLHTGFPHPRH